MNMADNNSGYQGYESCGRNCFRHNLIGRLDWSICFFYYVWVAPWKFSPYMFRNDGRARTLTTLLFEGSVGT